MIDSRVAASTLQKRNNGSMSASLRFGRKLNRVDEPGLE